MLAWRWCQLLADGRAAAEPPAAHCSPLVQARAPSVLRLPVQAVGGPVRQPLQLWDLPLPLPVLLARYLRVREGQAGSGGTSTSGRQT
jgi:hypothetical protein